MNIKENYKKVILIIILSLFFLLPNLVLGANELEINYPELPGGDGAPGGISNLSQYLSYIYNFAFYILGFIILGAIVYNGFIIVTSAGEPGKRSDATKNLRSTVLGAILVLSSFLILRAINPDLINPNLSDVEEVEASIRPGIYLCNYKMSSANTLLNDYISGEEEARREAAKTLKVMMNPGDEGKGCILVNSSGNINTSKFEMSPDTSEHTVFSIPTRSFSSGGSSVEVSYDYGIILHQFEDYEGKGVIYPSSIRDDSSGQSEPYQSPYYEPNSFVIDNDAFDFVPSSVTAFKRIHLSEDEKDKAAIEIYSQTGWQSSATSSNAAGSNILGSGAINNDFQSGTRLKTYSYNDTDGYFENNIKSIKVYPEGKFLVFLFVEDNAQDFDETYSYGHVSYLHKDFTNFLKTTNRSQSDLTDILPERTILWGDDGFLSTKPLISSILIIPARKQ